MGIRARTVSAYSIEVSWTDSSVLQLRGGVEDSAGKKRLTKNVDSVGKKQQTNKETKHVVMIKKTCL